MAGTTKRGLDREYENISPAELLAKVRARLATVEGQHADVALDVRSATDEGQRQSHAARLEEIDKVLDALGVEEDELAKIVTEPSA